MQYFRSVVEAGVADLEELGGPGTVAPSLLERLKNFRSFRLARLDTIWSRLNRLMARKAVSVVLRTMLVISYGRPDRQANLLGYLIPCRRGLQSAPEAPVGKGV